MQTREANQYTPLLDRISSIIWNDAEYFVFVPHTEHFGHIFWEIIMAVSIAKTTKRKLVLLKPKEGLYKIVNSDLFDCQFNCETEKRKIDSFIMRALLFYEQFRLKVLNRLLEFFHLFGLYKDKNITGRNHRCGIVDTAFVMPRVKGTRHYYDLEMLPESEPSIILTERQRNSAKAILENYGFDFSKWFAVSHVRQSGYRGYEYYHDARSFSQYAVLPIVKAVLSQKGFIVRLGANEQSCIPPTIGIFDYARSEIRSSLLDLFLMEKAKYYVGSSSGPMSMAFAFGKPVFCINEVIFLSAGMRKTDMFIPKIIYCPLDHRYVSIKEFCSNAISMWDTNRYWFIENRIEDIERAFADFTDFMQNGFRLNKEDSEIVYEWQSIRIQALKRILSIDSKNEFFESLKDVTYSSWNAPAIIAPSYLKKYLHDG